jgi:hypothetical protein
MTAADTLRLAFAGTRADRARVAITAIAAAVAVNVLLTCATVLAVEPDSGRYRSRVFNHDVLLSNVALAILLFAVPIMFFLAQCARLGAPGRDRRLAAFRLAGASPGQVVRIAAAETGVAAALGTLLGAGLFAVARVAFDRPGSDGLRALPTDVAPGPIATITVLVGVPVATVLLAIVLLREVSVTPFGVLRRTNPARVRAWPGLLGVVALVGLAGLEAASRTDFVRSGRLGAAQSALFALWILICTVLLALGLMLGTAWLGQTGARLLLRLTRRPSALIAARQTLADPYDGSRTYTVILIVAAFAGAAMMLKSWLTVNVTARAAASAERVRLVGGTVNDFAGTAAFRRDVFAVVDTAFLVLVGVTSLTLLVALVESGTARRRTVAALVAAGTPRAVLGRAHCWRVLIPAVPGIVLAILAGMFAMRSFTRTATGSNFASSCSGTTAQCADPAYAATHTVDRRINIVQQVPLPWADLASVAAVALVAVLLVIGISTLLQRSNTNPAELRVE